MPKHKRKAFVLVENVSTYVDYLNGVDFDHDDKNDDDYDPNDEEDLILDAVDDVDTRDGEYDDENDDKLRRFRIDKLRQQAICEHFLDHWREDNELTLEEYCTNPVYYSCEQELEDPLRVETVRRWFKKFNIGLDYLTRHKKVRNKQDKQEFIERSFDSHLDWDKFIKSQDEVAHSTARDWKEAYFKEHPRLLMNELIIQSDLSGSDLNNRLKDSGSLGFQHLEVIDHASYGRCVRVKKTVKTANTRIATYGHVVFDKPTQWDMYTYQCKVRLHGRMRNCWVVPSSKVISSYGEMIADGLPTVIDGEAHGPNVKIVVEAVGDECTAYVVNSVPLVRGSILYLSYGRLFWRNVMRRCIVPRELKEVLVWALEKDDLECWGLH